jgi:two-component system, NtrC family, response regulator HydG
MTRILLVEDDEDVRPLVEHVLLTAGYQVDSAASVRSAVILLRHRSYDLLVADGKLPDGTGMMAADRAAEKGIKALIITGYAFQLPSEDLLRCPYLLKPVRPNELLRGVEGALDQSTDFEQDAIPSKGLSS